MRAAHRSIALAAVTAAGCSDISVDVAFDVPDGYQELIDTVALDVVAPGEPPFGCRDLELGAVDEDQVDALVVDRALVGPGRADPRLDGVPRTGRKLFYARAYNPLGQLVAAGCAEHDLVDGDVDIAIEGRPAAYVSARDATLDRGELTRLQVALSDAHGAPLGGVRSRYSVVAARGATPERESTSNSDGSLDLTLDSPAWDGPQAVDLDVSWQANQIEPVTGFRTPPVELALEIPPADAPQDLAPARAYQIGRIGPDGEMGVAVLGPPTEAGDRFVHMFIGSAEPITSEIAVRAGALGMVAAGARDRLLVLDADAWHEIGPDGAVTTHPESLGLPGDATLIVPLPTECVAGAPRDRMLIDTGAGVVMLGADLEPRGSPLAAPDAALVAAGCLLGTGDVYPSAVFEREGGAFQLMAEIGGARPAVLPALVRRGIAFTPQIGDSATAGPYLLVNRLEVDGESIARYSLVRGPEDRLALDVELEDEVAGLSLATAGGDFDDDDQLDVAGLLLLSDLDQEQEVRFFMALGATLEDQRLAGVSDARATGSLGTQRFLDSQLLSADLDGDGVDELIIASRTRADIYDLKP